MIYTESNEEIIQLLTDRILDGAEDEELLAEGYSSVDIEIAHINYLSIYF